MRIVNVLIALCMVGVMLVSCHRNMGDHIPPKIMSKILFDINIAESYSITLKDTLHRNGIKNTDSLATFYKDIFAHYNITQQQFETSMTWYKEHPEDLDTMYVNMLPALSKATGNKMPQRP